MGDHGGRIVILREDLPDGGHLVRAEHVGPDRHDEVPVGGQCRCGMINFGAWRQRSKGGFWKKGAGC